MCTNFFCEEAMGATTRLANLACEAIALKTYSPFFFGGEKIGSHNPTTCMFGDEAKLGHLTEAVHAEG